MICSIRAVRGGTAGSDGEMVARALHTRWQPPSAVICSIRAPRGGTAGSVGKMVARAPHTRWQPPSAVICSIRAPRGGTADRQCSSSRISRAGPSRDAGAIVAHVCVEDGELQEARREACCGAWRGAFAQGLSGAAGGASASTACMEATRGVDLRLGQRLENVHHSVLQRRCVRLRCFTNISNGSGL